MNTIHNRNHRVFPHFPTFVAIGKRKWRHRACLGYARAVCLIHLTNYIMCPPIMGLQGCNTKKQIVWEMKSVALIWPIFCHQKSIMCVWNGWWPGIVFPALRLGRTLQPRHAFISFELQVKEKKNNQTMRKLSKPFKAIKRTAVNRMSMPWNVWKKSTRRVA